MKTYTNVHEYIRTADAAHTDALKKMRAVVKKTAPAAIERISYGMPAYTWKREPLFYFAAMKGHLGLYPTPGPIQACKDILTPFSTSKGCVRVPWATNAPTKVVVALIRARQKEIRAHLA